MELNENLEAAHPELEAVRAVAGEDPVYVVGGAVRDLLLGRSRADVDLVVVGDAAALAAKLGAESVEHERFATAKVTLDGHEIDVATARTESYPEPGALPVIEPAGSIEADLGRRDFTINTMALPLRGAGGPIDPFGGRADLEVGLLRVLHERSFVDDPTRGLRAARYAARFDFELEAETAELLKAADLSTVSQDRREAELLRLAGEEEAVRGFALAAEWGLIEPAPDGLTLMAKTAELIADEPWSLAEDRARMLRAMAMRPAGRESELLEAGPTGPSEAVELAQRFHPPELVSARVRGAEWLDEYVREWRHVKLEIGGDDLVAAGVPQGPAVGAGLAEALRRKLDGQIDGREQELETALAVARAEAGS